MTVEHGVARYYRALYAPGSGKVRRIGDFTATRDALHVFFLGDRFDAGYATMRGLYAAEAGRSPALLRQGDLDMPRMAPDDRHLAYVVHGDAGDVVEILDRETRHVTRRTPLRGHVEQLAWSPDGKQLLALVAGLGADRSGRDGGTMPGPDGAGVGAPLVSPNLAEDLWRRVWRIASDGSGEIVSPAGQTIWEAAWCGNDAIVTVATPDPTENAWYDATLIHFAWRTGLARELYRPTDQIGLPACAPDGTTVAFVEAVCSDRGLVCGALKLLDTSTGVVRSPDTNKVDVSSVAFRATGAIHYAGLRSFETVVGEMGRDDAARELWTAADATCGVWHPASLPIGDDKCMFVREGPMHPPELVLLSPGAERPCFAVEDAAPVGKIDVRPVSWTAPDGTMIDGLVLLPPHGAAPYPCMMDIHGGPVLAHRPRWIGHVRMGWLLARGFALFLPNPRGSCGRGRAFAAAVRGDMGGGDAADLLSGIDHLVDQGLVDPGKLAISGSSYGGYMSAWLVTQTDRFSASIAISPISNWHSQHGTSQIGRFDAIFLDDPALRIERSPVLQADKVRTPTLLLAGALDRNTPPGQAQEFHTALLDRQVPTQYVLYPTGGHSLRDLPILIDTAERADQWIGTWVK